MFLAISNATVADSLFVGGSLFVIIFIVIVVWLVMR